MPNHLAATYHGKTNHELRHRISQFHGLGRTSKEGENMFLYNALLHHWAFAAIYIVALVLTIPTLDEFWRENLLNNPTWCRFTKTINGLPKPSKWLGYILTVVVFIVPVRLLLAPILWIFMVRSEAQKRKEQVKQARIAREKKDRENERRTDLRKQWLAENRPKLYLNTISGITAVQLPADFEAAKEETRAAIYNGFWERDNLRPYRETLLFVTKQGYELMAKSAGCDPAHAIGGMTGWMSELDVIARAANIELVHAEEIFVPWVNETFLSFQEQRNILNARNVNACTQYHLVERQMPKELLPV